MKHISSGCILKSNLVHFIVQRNGIIPKDAAFMVPQQHFMPSMLQVHLGLIKLTCKIVFLIIVHFDISFAVFSVFEAFSSLKETSM